VSQTIEQIPLASTLRALRLEGDVHLRRTVHLAAAKIEDLEEQVAALAAELEASGRRATRRRSRMSVSRH